MPLAQGDPLSYDRASHPLTARQSEIAVLAAHGLSNKNIARELGLAEGTVKLHLHKAYSRLRVRNRTSLVSLIAAPYKAPRGV